MKTRQEYEVVYASICKQIGIQPEPTVAMSDYQLIVAINSVLMSQNCITFTAQEIAELAWEDILTPLPH